MNLKQNKKISVITVSYNQGEFIRDNIESVLAQNYQNFEHIIIDGGSTDNTLEVLKEYPHLNWVSEPDRNQSHALNKGFNKASGDIICWLNSDDYLAENAFLEVVKKLENNDLLLGAAGEVTKEKEVVNIVKNHNRTYNELAKFWLPNTWLAQTGVFFTKALLDSVKLANGDYLDEKLEFCMDYDLWLRMFSKTTKIASTDLTLAYFRMYETNKTGEMAEATQRECASVYKVNYNRKFETERDISIIIAVNHFATDNVQKTLKSIINQNLFNIEIILINTNKNSNPKEFWKTITELDVKFEFFSIRTSKKVCENIFDAYNYGARISKGRNLLFLKSGAELEKDFCLHVTNQLSSSPLAVVIPGDELDLDFKDETGILCNNLADLYKIKTNFPALAVNRMCFSELNGFILQNEDLGVLHFLQRVQGYKWYINFSKDLKYTEEVKTGTKNKLTDIFEIFLRIDLNLELSELLKNNSYLKNNNSEINFLPIKDEEINRQNLIMNSIPRNWHSLDYKNDEQKLLQITNQSELFYPAWYFLSKIYEGRNEIDKKIECEQKYNEGRGRFY